MPPSQSFPSVLVPVALAGFLGLGAPVAAQNQQEPAAALLPSGSCGQALGLTAYYVFPIDTMPPHPAVIAMAQSEPRYVEFVLEARAAVQLETSYPEGAEADPFMVLYDTEGAIVASDDDGGAGLNARLDLVLEPGRYCAQVKFVGYQIYDPVEVTLDISAEPVADPAGVDPGAVFADGSGLACSDPARTIITPRLTPGFGALAFEGRVPPASSADWVMALDQPMALRIEASDNSLDTVLALRDASRALLAENDDYPGMGTDSRIDVTLDPGAYCISITGFAGSGGAARLDIIEAAQPDAQPEPAPGGQPGGQPGDGQIGGIAGDPEGAPPGTEAEAAPGGPVFAAGAPCGDPARTLMLGRLARGFGSVTTEGVVPNNDQQDWIVSLADPMELRLDANSGVFDTVLSVFDTGGGLIEENDDSPEGGTDSLIIRAFAPGDYCLSVRGFGGSGGGLELTVSERAAAPAPDPAPAPAPGGIPGLPGVPEGTQDAGLSDAFRPGQPCGDPAATEVLGPLQAGFLQTYLQGVVPAGGTRDVAVDLREQLDMTATATSDEFDTVLSVFNAEGQLLAENDDYPGMGTNSRVSDGFGPGPVCFSLRGFAGSGGAFELGLFEDEPGAAPAPAPTPAPAPGGILGQIEGDPPAQGPGPGPCGAAAVTLDAGPLAARFGQVVTTLHVQPQGRANVAFSIADGAVLRIETMETDFDTVLEVHDTDGLVDENDDSPEGGTDSLLTLTLPAGDFCASVRGFAGAGGRSDLVISEPTAAPGGAPAAPGGMALPGPGSGIEMVDLGPLGPGGLAHNELGASGPTWLVFELTAAGAVRVDALNLMGPFTVGLFDASSGEMRAGTDGWGGMETGTIAVSLPAGRYAVGLDPDLRLDAGLRRIEIRLDD